MSGDEKASKNSSPSLSQSVMPSQPSNRSSCRESRQNVEGVHVIEGLKLGCTNMENPQRHEGFLLKKRKWPLKGWHKRFFILENGILKYAKSPIEVQRGKLHGCIDVGLSVMSIKKHSQCIDLDTEEYIYHLKIKSPEAFDSWVCKLRDHRLFRQNEIAHSPGDTSRTLLSPLESSPAVHFADEKLSCSSSSAGLSGALSNGQSKLSGWLFHSDEMEQCAQDLSEGQEGLVQLNAIIKSLEILQRTQSVPSFSDMQGSCLENCKKEKRSSKRWRTKSVSKDSKMHLQLPMSPVCSPVRLHASNPNLSLETTHNQEPVMGNCGGQAGFWVGGLWSGGRKSLGSWGSETGTGPCLVVPSLPVSHTQSSLGESLQEYVGDSARLQMEYCQLAQKVHFLLRTVFNMVAIEKDKLKQVVSEQEALNSGHAAQINNLKKTLAQALHQNTELRNRLNRIHSESSLTETMASLNGLSPDVARDSFGVTDHVMNHQTSNDSKLSMSESMSEFFDAQEVLLSASSSDNEASDESCGSDVSDNASEDTMSLSSGTGCTVVGLMPLQNGRRRFLPAPAPDTSSISLWHLLRHNIGKDLAKVALPVELNEPLNTLQRLCEELEYSELLEAAAETDDPTQRMVLVAAFAVSGYAATYYRAGNKPFNPVLGETYECVREDRGFRFIAEQVSHHPPISACHCDSKNFVFWQDVRWKNKFWGKSMEILPVGTIHLTLPKYGDHYEWSKITSCIHNILNGPRWIEHYGEIVIRNKQKDSCISKLTFVKGSYWNSSVNEVQGGVFDSNGKVLHCLFGKWHEGLYCGVPPAAKCVWRPGSMPKDFELCYGFTKFAIELNELDEATKHWLPSTDTRFRPDQRLLEQGDIEGASEKKHQIEEIQRVHQRCIEESCRQYQPCFFQKVVEADGKEKWVTNNTYWKLRKDPGFSQLDNPLLW